MSVRDWNGVEVVGEVFTTEEALYLNGALRPDLVVLDIRLGEAREGLALCKQLKVFFQRPAAVLIFTARTQGRRWRR